MRHPLRRKNLSPRLLPFYALAAAGLWLARPTPRSFALGGALVAAGAALRLWGAGHLVKTDRLTVGGPYAYLRHPLYAGTLLLGLGFGAIAGPPGWLLVGGGFLPIFLLYYVPYKERVESERLVRRWGEPYRLYRAAVPGFLPRGGPWRPPERFAGPAPEPWSALRVRANDELGVLAGVVAGLAALAGRAWLG